MKTLYLDCFAGIAGDMFLGALLDLGIDENTFREQLESLHVSGYELQIERTRRKGFMGTNVKVSLNDACCGHSHEAEHDYSHGHGTHPHSHRGLAEIKSIIATSSLSEKVKERSCSAFQFLAEAEGAVHGIGPEEVHFHEVGAVDSIVDIVGAFILIEMLGTERVCASPVNVGSGTVECAHGVLPVPAPATARILEGIPVFSRGTPMERTTPTGALLLRVLADSFGPIPDGVIVATGYGFGDRESDLPNMLRACLLETSENAVLPYSAGKAVVMETNIDDMNPQDYQELEDRLFTVGALDVFFTPIMMKKMRPAVRLTCIALPEDRELLGEMILRHSTSIGVRWSEVSRMTLRRKIENFESSVGSVRMKLSSWNGEVLRVTPEYEDLRAIAQKLNVPIGDLRHRVLSEYYARKEPCDDR